MDWVPRQLLPRSKEYLVLPTSSSSSSSSRPQPTHPHLRRFGCSWLWLWLWLWRLLTLRRVLLSAVFTPVFLLLVIVGQGIPPSYNDIRSFERRLPQHSISPWSAPGAHAHHHHPPRYLRFPGHLWGHGLNNVLQETLLMSYLAYVSNVSFVFEDYTWSQSPLPWAVYDFALRPARIPLNAIISGPTAGGPMPQGSDAPAAVSAEFYDRVCRGPDTQPYVLSSASAPNDADGAVIIDWWANQLASVRARCIEIDSTPHELFDRFLFGGPRILSLWESLASSPILSDFTWSPLVQSALARNFALLQPKTVNDIYFTSSSSEPALQALVAVHLRRGDYSRHCPNLAKWGADYMGLNQYPTLLDRFDPSPYSNDSTLKEEYYLSHCLPTIEEIVARLRTVRREHHTQSGKMLERVYVLSNDWPSSLEDLKCRLVEDGWLDVTTSVDLQLDPAQYHVSMAVDMAIAEKAEVFIGNGFSSLSSNVVMLRMAKGMDVRSNRFL